MQNFGLKNVEQLLTACHGIPRGMQTDAVYDKEKQYEIYYGFQNPIVIKKEVPQEDQITALCDIVGNYFVYIHTLLVSYLPLVFLLIK